MAPDREQIDRHIAVLEEFEQKYGEFLVARHDAVMGHEDRWSRAEWARRERELRALAVRADDAMLASGLGNWVITHPPAMGGRIKSTDLASAIFDFQDEFMGAGDRIQQQILARIPSQIEGAEDAPRGSRRAEAPEEAPCAEKAGRVLVARTEPVAPSGRGRGPCRGDRRAHHRSPVGATPVG